MEMDVENALSPVHVAIHDGSIACVCDAFAPRELLRSEDELPYERAVGSGQIVQCRDVPPRNYEDMCRGLRVDIAEGEHVGVFVHEVGRDLASDDPAEQAVARHGDLSLFQVEKSITTS
jgi:hypothetical protein